MKLTVFQFEGTAAELDASETLRALTEGSRGTAVAVGVGRDGGDGGAGRVPGVAEEGQETVRRLLERSPAPELFTAFLQEATQWPNVGVHGIRRKNAAEVEVLDYSRYLRLRKQGSQFGGFAYVYAERSSINLRLSMTQGELAGAGIGSARVLTTGHREYRVSVDLKDRAGLDDALRLARMAYDAT
ncbi:MULTISPECIES: hypothetical protein [unclassified Streptomyces]|uniref:hypothetical protein n=1 Tax=unclassified Streptomyces TaxID=2593676 RepID=UPI0004BD1AA4|nr:MULTISPECIES: hypothetical protein [unclassified Streptomyces]